MIRRPNVRARCLQPNLQARHPGNRKYYPREYRMYSRQCRWCHRPVGGRMDPIYAYLCLECGTYLHVLEADHHIYRGPGPFNAALMENRPVRKILKVNDTFN